MHVAYCNSSLFLSKLLHGILCTFLLCWWPMCLCHHYSCSGHRSEVTCLTFDHSSTRLVSGGKDTHLIVWDVVNEAGLFRLQGHKGPITHCVFMKNSNTLISRWCIEMPQHSSHSRVFGPNCTLHTAITHVVTVLKWWNLMWIPLVYSTQDSTIQHCDHMSDSSVQPAVMTKSS